MNRMIHFAWRPFLLILCSHSILAEVTFSNNSWIIFIKTILRIRPIQVRINKLPIVTSLLLLQTCRFWLIIIICSPHSHIFILDFRPRRSDHRRFRFFRLELFWIGLYRVIAFTWYPGLGKTLVFPIRDFTHDVGVISLQVFLSQSCPLLGFGRILEILLMRHGL